MTPEAALFKFFNGFGIPAYPATSVPADAVFPYITYALTTGAFWDGPVAVQVDIWYRGDSESAPNAKAREMSAGISAGGRIIPCDAGAMWLKRGSPFCRSLGDPADGKIKRRNVNIEIDYITSD